MDDQRTMAQLLEAPTAGYEDAIVVPEITADNFELNHRTVSISEPIGIAEDVYVTVGKFQFPADYVVVCSLRPDPPSTSNPRRKFLKRPVVSINRCKRLGEITLRVGREAITFNLDQTSRYTANYNHMTANRIDVIDMACEEYSQEVLGFTECDLDWKSHSLLNGPIVSIYQSLLLSTLTPYRDTPEVELKELPPQTSLEYAILECCTRLPVKIAKDLRMRKFSSNRDLVPPRRPSSVARGNIFAMTNLQSQLKYGVPHRLSTRPFTIVQVFPYGTVELSQNSGPNFKVNGHRLKHYFGGDIPAMDIPDLQTFPKDN
ncbi:hypothetical protein Tco_0343956 [Tanacetum coccineum]